MIKITTYLSLSNVWIKGVSKPPSKPTNYVPFLKFPCLSIFIQNVMISKWQEIQKSSFSFVELSYITYLIHLYLSFPIFIYLFVYLFIANLLIFSFSIWKCDFNTYKGFFKNLGPNLLDVEKQLSNFYSRFQQVAKIWKDF
jgi:hypothetical protein